MGDRDIRTLKQTQHRTTDTREGEGGAGGHARAHADDTTWLKAREPPC